MTTGLDRCPVEAHNHTVTTTETLPRIVQFIERTDSGEYGNDTCAHCGALGRYQFTFLGDDGKRHKAMAGCIRKFKVAPIADAHAKLITKKADQERLGRKLNGWDAKKLAAIESFYAGEIDEDAALAVIREQDRQATAWRKQKFGGRR